MRVKTVCTSSPRVVQAGGREVLTGIFNAPVAGRVRVERRNIAGDRQADLTVHGGLDKAVYAFASEHYAHWEGVLGRDGLAPGHFGENLTTEGLLEGEVLIGEQFTIGSAVLEASQPRVPCFKLGLRMERRDFPKLFLANRLTGIYFRVVGEGELEAGDAIKSVGRPSGGMSVREVLDLTFDAGRSKKETARLMDHRQLANQWKEMLRGL